MAPPRISARLLGSDRGAQRQRQTPASRPASQRRHGEELPLGDALSLVPPQRPHSEGRRTDGHRGRAAPSAANAGLCDHAPLPLCFERRWREQARPHECGGRRDQAAGEHDSPDAGRRLHDRCAVLALCARPTIQRRCNFRSEGFGCTSLSPWT